MSRGIEEMDGQVGSVTAQECLDQHTYGRAHDLSEYVPVIFARGIADAENFKYALEERGIPTLVESDSNGISPLSTLTRRVPVLVPAEMLDDASEMIARIEQQPMAGFDDDDLDDDDDDLDDYEDEDDEDDDEEDHGSDDDEDF